MKSTSYKKKGIFSFCMQSIVILLCAVVLELGLNSMKTTNLENKNNIVAEITAKYEKLVVEHKKSQELVKATTEEVKRLTQELKEYKTNNLEVVFSEKSNKLGLEIVSDHIKENESFSDISYCDSDGKYRNGYGTLSKMLTYKVGDTVKLRDCKGKIVTVTATKGNQVLPERKITVDEALARKEDHIIKNVFPYLYGKTFRSPEEFIVATDVIYNRGIALSKNLFNSDGTINCKSLYNYMDHSKDSYKSIMRKRYAKNYALCIQS